MNPYKYLKALDNGGGYRYVKNLEVVSECKEGAKHLSKFYDFMSIAVDAYEHEEYRSLKNNEKLIQQRVVERYLKYDSYKDIQRDFCAFLQGKGDSYAIPGNWGPPSRETTLMASQLCGLMQEAFDFLTWDSQPGIYIVDEDEQYLQVPYLFLSGPPDKVKALLEVLARVKYKGTNVVQLVDPTEYERAKKKYGISGKEEGEGLNPAHYLADLGLKKLSFELEGHDLVMLSSPPMFWHLPFFTIIYNAAFDQALDQKTIELNYKLP